MVELKEERLRKSLSEAKNHWQGQKDLNPRHAVLERLGSGIILYHLMPQSSKNAVTISNLGNLQH